MTIEPMMASRWRRVRSRVALVVGVVLAMTVTGCSAPGPVLYPTPDRLVVTGTGVSSVNALGDVLDRATFRQPLSSMYRVFRSALGAPTQVLKDDGERYEWGDQLELREGSERDGARSQLYVGVRSFRGVTLVAAERSVGDDFPRDGATPTCAIMDSELISARFLQSGPTFGVTFESGHRATKIEQFQAPLFMEGC